MDLKFLKSAAQFIKENYEPWRDLHEDDTVLWLLDSWKKQLIFPMLIGSRDHTEIIAVYQFWLVSSDYVRAVKNDRSNMLLLPGPRDVGGELFCPLSVIGTEWKDKGYKVSWMIDQKVGTQFPTAKGYYRWVLQSQRVKFIKFRR